MTLARDEMYTRPLPIVKGLFGNAKLPIDILREES